MSLFIFKKIKCVVFAGTITKKGKRMVFNPFPLLYGELIFARLAIIFDNIIIADKHLNWWSAKN